MLEQPIQNPDKVDLVGRKRDGGVDLFIVASGPLDGSEKTQRSLLNKVRNYLVEIKAPEFQTEFKHPPPDKTMIVLSCKTQPDSIILQLISRIKPWVAENNARFELRVG